MLTVIDCMIAEYAWPKEEVEGRRRDPGGASEGDGGHDAGRNSGCVPGVGLAEQEEEKQQQRQEQQLQEQHQQQHKKIISWIISSLTCLYRSIEKVS